ncbi:hybrid sensor histidine kinase/response regulator [Streptacidiphilus sp. N1-12]|uniref:histidine kinase n=2 Tax=Streptacidiphilus alkalitolerans TaxID=3342712 RepID=A0ABV6WQR7_9ACTN
MPTPSPRAAETLLTTTVHSERDVFALRRYGRTAAEAVGLERQDQVRLATVLSELGRDLLRPEPMTARFTLADEHPRTLVVALDWDDGRGPSAESLAAVRRLFPQVGESRGNGSEGGGITVECPIPARTATPPGFAESVRANLRVAGAAETSTTEDLRAQTRDLMASLEEARSQREELQRLNLELEETNQGVLALYTELSTELEETNRGVVALYAELEDKSRLLREASESKTRFWSNVSHELRTPLNSVVGLSRLMLDPASAPLSAEQRRQVGLISSSGSMLLALVDELLDVAKAEAGRLEPRPARVDLAALLTQLRGIMLGTAPQGDAVAVIVPEVVEPALLLTDEVLLTRILRNLLSNALKFTRAGEVRLEVEQEAGGVVVFRVSDTGIGIPADQQERVFEEFYQVPGENQVKRPGTGLGLPYARRLAELMGGTLTLNSTPGRGTEVTLRLPPPDGEDGAVQRIPCLVAVDDDPVFHELFRPLLDGIAERVVPVHDGALVLAAVRRERPQGVVLDLQMPGTDGYAVLAQLAADPELRTVPVVVITAADPDEQDHSRLTHARAVLSKHGATARRLADALKQQPRARS